MSQDFAYRSLGKESCLSICALYFEKLQAFEFLNILFNITFLPKSLLTLNMLYCYCKKLHKSTCTFLLA